MLTEAVRPRVTRANVGDLYKKYVFVESSNLHSVYYNPQSRELRVRFLGGSEYKYDRVPERLFIALLNASSHGKEFWKIIRDVFPYERLADWDEDDWDEDEDEDDWDEDEDDWDEDEDDY